MISQSRYSPPNAARLFGLIAVSILVIAGFVLGNSTVSARTLEAGVPSVGISLPSSGPLVGRPYTFDLWVKNSGTATTNAGYLDVSITGSAASGARVEYDARFDTGWDEGPDIYSPGQLIWHRTKGQITAQHSLVTAKENAWSTGELRKMKVTITPSRSGELVLRYRGTLDSRIEPSDSVRVVDQQGWPVFIKTLRVEKPTAKLEIIEFDAENTPWEWGKQAQIDARVKNNGTADANVWVKLIASNDRVAWDDDDVILEDWNVKLAPGQTWSKSNFRWTLPTKPYRGMPANGNVYYYLHVGDPFDLKSFESVQMSTPAAKLEIIDFDAENTPWEWGKEAQIDAVVKNNGTADADVWVKLIASNDMVAWDDDDVILEDWNVKLAPGQTWSKSNFRWPLPTKPYRGMPANGNVYYYLHVGDPFDLKSFESVQMSTPAQHTIELHRISKNDGMFHGPNPGTEQKSFNAGDFIRITARAKTTGPAINANVVVNLAPTNNQGNLVCNSDPQPNNRADRQLVAGGAWVYWSFDCRVDESWPVGDYSFIGSLRDSSDWNKMMDETTPGPNTIDWRDSWQENVAEVIGAAALSIVEFKAEAAPWKWGEQAEIDASVRNTGNATADVWIKLIASNDKTLWNGDDVELQDWNVKIAPGETWRKTDFRWMLPERPYENMPTNGNVYYYLHVGNPHDLKDFEAVTMSGATGKYPEAIRQLLRAGELVYASTPVAYNGKGSTFYWFANSAQDTDPLIWLTPSVSNGLPIDKITGGALWDGSQVVRSMESIVELLNYGAVSANAKNHVLNIHMPTASIDKGEYEELISRDDGFDGFIVFWQQKGKSRLKLESEKYAAALTEANRLTSEIDGVFINKVSDAIIGLCDTLCTGASLAKSLLDADAAHLAKYGLSAREIAFLYDSSFSNSVAGVLNNVPGWEIREVKTGNAFEVIVSDPASLTLKNSLKMDRFEWAQVIVSTAAAAFSGDEDIKKLSALREQLRSSGVSVDPQLMAGLDLAIRDAQDRSDRVYAAFKDAVIELSIDKATTTAVKLVPVIASKVGIVSAHAVGGYASAVLIGYSVSQFVYGLDGVYDAIQIGEYSGKIHYEMHDVLNHVAQRMAAEVETHNGDMAASAVEFMKWKTLTAAVFHQSQLGIVRGGGFLSWLDQLGFWKLFAWFRGSPDETERVILQRLDEVLIKYSELESPPKLNPAIQVIADRTLGEVNGPEYEVELFAVTDTSGQPHSSGPGDRRSEFSEGETIRITLRAMTTGLTQNVNLVVNLAQSGQHGAQSCNSDPDANNRADAELPGAGAWTYWSFDCKVTSDWAEDSYDLLAAVRSATDWSALLDESGPGSNSTSWTNAWIHGVARVVEEDTGGKCSVADLTGDCLVDLKDFAVFAGAWGSRNASADLNQNGIVDLPDFAQFAGEWGSKS